MERILQIKINYKTKGLRLNTREKEMLEQYAMEHISNMYMQGYSSGELNEYIHRHKGPQLVTGHWEIKTIEP